MNSELKAYLNNFLTDTLGLRSILTDAAENTSIPEVVNEMYILFIENLKSYNSAESDLLEKMIAALKLKSGELKVLDFNLRSVSSCEPSQSMILKDEPSQANETYSPRILLLKPELKRKAWDDLKIFFSIP